MYKKISSVLFPIATIMLIVALYWGFQQQQQKNEMLTKSENQYQRAYGNLTYYLGQLDTQMGQTLAISSTSNGYYRKGLINVWRLTSEAQQQIGQLPTNYIPFNDTETFLTKLANFSYKAAVRDLDTEPLTETELASLEQLYTNAKEINQRLVDLQAHISRAGLRWIDVELALASDDLSDNNPVIATLRDMNTTVGAYEQIDWGPAVNTLYTDDNIKLLSGQPITSEDALRSSEQFLGMTLTNAEVVENGLESQFPTITIKYNPYSLTYVKNGGLLVGYNVTRDVGQAVIDEEQAEEAAEQFLELHKYDELEVSSYSVNDNIASIIYVAEQDDVMIYPDKLSLRIALDNGEVIGLQASEYVSHHHKRDIVKPELSKEKAMQSLSAKFKLDDTELAIIKGDLGEEVLCYQFTGTIDNKRLRIFINANNGREENFETLN